MHVVSYGGGRVNRTNAAKVTVGTHSSTQNYQLNMAGGTGIMDSGDTNHASGTAATWFLFTAAIGTGREAYPHSFNTTTKAMGAQLATNFGLSGGGSFVGEISQLTSDRGTHSHRTGALYSGGYAVDLNSSLSGWDNSFTTSGDYDQFYSGAGRISDTQGFTHSQNGYAHGLIPFTYSGGGSLSAQSGNSAGVNATFGGNGNAIYGLVNFFDASSPGGGSSYANLGTAGKVCYVSHNNVTTPGSDPFVDTDNTMYISVISWDGVNGNAPTRNGSAVAADTTGADSFTVPTHTGSTYTPKLLATTWGNVVLHGDTNDPTNDCVFPVTWSSDDATIGSSVQWPDNIGVNLTDCYWKGLDGIGRDGVSKFHCGQSRTGDANIYRTFAFRNVNSNTEIDIIKVDFSESSGKHEVEMLHRNVHTITGVTLSAGADADPIFMENNTDLLLWVRGTNASDATECSTIYIENAFYGGAALGY